MASRNQDQPAALSTDSAPGMALPLLPTLVVAVAVAALSLVCREPASPATAPIAETIVSAATVVSEPPTLPITPATALAPAILAFSNQFPVVVEARVAEAPRRRPAPRIAIAQPAPRRADPARPAALAAQTVVEPASTEQAFEGRASAEPDEPALPSLALPFAPAIRAITQARDFVGAQGAAAGAEAAALGESVASLVGRLR